MQGENLNATQKPLLKKVIENHLCRRRSIANICIKLFADWYTNENFN